MNGILKHVVLDENPIFKRARPILLKLFCQGMLSIETKYVVYGALISIAISPFLWLVGVFAKGIHIAILLTAWWVLRDYIVEYGHLHYLLLSMGVIAILYKSTYETLVDIFLNILLVATGGGVLRWLCKGYLSEGVFRQKMMTSGYIADFVAPLASSLPHKYSGQYNEIMDLYLAINQPGNEEKLCVLLESYENGDNLFEQPPPP